MFLALLSIVLLFIRLLYLRYISLSVICWVNSTALGDLSDKHFTLAHSCVVRDVVVAVEDVPVRLRVRTEGRKTKRHGLS